MKILLYAEEALRVDLKTISENLNSICRHLKFRVGDGDFQIPSRQITYPASYESLAKPIVRRSEKADYTFLFSSKQYYNNYFFETYHSNAIISFYAWQHLTKLSRNNGIVFFIADLIALRIDNSFRHDDITGCIYDFRWKKTGIDLAMRSAFICPSCLKRISPQKLSRHKQGLLSDLKEILDVLGRTSKWNQDIVTYWQSIHPSPTKSSNKKKTSNASYSKKYDVFLAHNSSDKPFVETVNLELKRRNLKPWFDKDKIPPGRFFQDVIQRTIRNVASAAIFVGRNGLGRWQVVELRSFISQCVNRGIPVIPVLLPGVARVPTNLVFLNEFSWVKFRNSANEIDALDNLVWGITGNHPRHP